MNIKTARPDQIQDAVYLYTAIFLDLENCFPLN